MATLQLYGEVFMDIKKIYMLFEQVGCLTFATINGAYPETRIVDLLTYDADGIYFFTMKTKPFYKQLKENGTVSICGLAANPQTKWLENGNPYNSPGYFIRATGDVREFTVEDAMAKDPAKFKYLMEDHKRYPQITGFCLYNFHGEIYDYDFEKEHRGHKLERERFSFGNIEAIPAGLMVDRDKCISCGECEKTCTFAAIHEDDDSYKIDGKRCDECGNCFTVCPSNAIIHKGI